MTRAERVYINFAHSIMVSYKKRQQYDNFVTNCTHRNKVCSFISQSSLVKLQKDYFHYFTKKKKIKYTALSHWVNETVKRPFSLVIDTMPTAIYLDWYLLNDRIWLRNSMGVPLNSSLWDTMFFVCFIHQNHLGQKKKRQRGFRCWYKFSCHCPSDSQSRSAAQCKEGTSLKHLQRVVPCITKFPGPQT